MKSKYLEKSYIFDVAETVDFNGKKIELKRNVDLAKYNDYETEAKAIDWQVRCDSENKEFDITAWRIIKAYADRFILQATEDGIKRYESILGIEADGTLIERRRRVYFLWNKNIAYTDRTLRAMLDVLVGKGSYYLELIYDEYGIILEVIVNKKMDLNDLYYILRRDILPCNLDIELRIKLLNNLIVQDKTLTYTTPFYPVGYHHKCGTIFRHQYVGKRVVNNLNLRNAGAARKQRQFNTGEIRSGGVKR